MKKLYFSILLILSFCSLQAQLSITSNDMPADNDTIRISELIEVEGYDFSSAGPDYVWDFAAMNYFNQRLDTFVHAAATPLAYQWVFIPVIVSNLAQPLSEFEYLPDFEVSDVYLYFNNTAADYRELGFALSISGIPLPVKYNQPDVYYEFPLNYQNEFSGFSNYSFEISGLFHMSGWKERSTEVDGWGEVITPFGSFECLRLKSEVIRYDSIFIDTLGTGIPLMRNYIEYKWLGKNLGLPIISAIEEASVFRVEYIDSLRYAPGSVIESFAFPGSVKIHPNPVAGNARIMISSFETGQCRVELLDAGGESLKLLFNEWISASEVRTLAFKAMGFDSGLYFVKTSLDDRFSIRKLIIP